jgi:hypothetical protein
MPSGPTSMIRPSRCLVQSIPGRAGCASGGREQTIGRDTKGAKTRFITPAYGKFESSSLQRSVCKPLVPGGLAPHQVQRSARPSAAPSPRRISGFRESHRKIVNWDKHPNREPCCLPNDIGKASMRSARSRMKDEAPCRISPEEQITRGARLVLLFLALHLSVEPKLPWLILDDPVQSTDCQNTLTDFW